MSSIVCFLFHIPIFCAIALSYSDTLFSFNSNFYFLLLFLSHIFFVLFKLNLLHRINKIIVKLDLFRNGMNALSLGGDLC